MIIPFIPKKEEEEKIFKIFNIYVSNSFGRGLRIETSRFNHSCQPNANPCHVYDQDQINHEQIRAISDIKKGEEITISYLKEYDFLLRNRQFRQDHLHMGWFFICSCDLCKNEVEDKDDMFQELIQEAYRYHHVNSINGLRSLRLLILLIYLDNLFVEIETFLLLALSIFVDAFFGKR